MPSNTALDPGQVLQIASYLNAIGNIIRNILNDPNVVLSNDQSNLLSSDLISISNVAANLSTWAAQVVFADSDSAFDNISNATQVASTKLQSLQKDVAKMSSILNIVADVVNLGVAFGTGNVAGILSASSSLYGDASSS